MRILFFALASLFATVAIAEYAVAPKASYKYYSAPANDYNTAAKFCCFLDWGVSGWFSRDVEFPDAQVYNTSTGKTVSLRSLVVDKPIVLEMGSLTCPAYDINVKGMEALAKKYKGKVDFYTLYVRENHPNDKYDVHTTMEQKIKYAKDLSRLSHLNHTVLVDDVQGSLHQALGNFGNSVYLIGTDYHVNHWSIFATPNLLDKGIVALMKTKGIAKNAEFVGGSDIHPISQTTHTAKERAQTGATMEARGEKAAIPLDVKKGLAIYNELPGVKTAFQQMPKESQDGLLTFVKKYCATEPTSNRLMQVSTEPMTEFNTSFRPEYRRRYNTWEKMNNMSSKENIADTQLQTPR